MNNYEKMLDSGRRRFLEYDITQIAKRPGVTDSGDCLTVRFLGQTAQIRKSNGQIFLDGRPGNFGECLTIYDWLCDGKVDAHAAGEYCPVGSLPGVYVRGSGLAMNGASLASRIDGDPESFKKACLTLGGQPIQLGDIGFQILAFKDLPMQLKFYFSDEEFPASLTLLWDRNILQFIRYETVYYLARCLLSRIEELIGAG